MAASALPRLKWLPLAETTKDFAGNPVAEAYHWIADLWLTQSRTLHGATRNLIGGNASYKADIFKENFRFDERIVFGGSETGALFPHCAGQIYTPLLFDDLKVTHVMDMGVMQFIRKAHFAGTHSLADATAKSAGRSHQDYQKTLPI